jgi:hypothetical protein
MIGNVVAAEHLTCPVRQQSRTKTGHQGEVLHPSDGQNFHGKNGARDRCAEYGSEAGRDPRHQDDPRVVIIKPKQAAEGTGKASAHLNSRPLSPGRSTKEVGQDR